MYIHATELSQYKNNDHEYNKRRTTMKMKFSKEWMEQKTGGNDNHKYIIRGFKWHLLGAVAVAVAFVFFFVLSVCWFFENKRWTKIKLKVSVILTEQKNYKNVHRKYVIRGFKRHLPYDVAVGVALDEVLFISVATLIVWK